MRHLSLIRIVVSSCLLIHSEFGHDLLFLTPSPNAVNYCLDQGAKLVEIDSWQEDKAIGDRIRALGFFVVKNKIVVVIADVVIVDAQVTQQAKTVLDGID